MTIISVNELVTTCQKIIELYGYGWGSNTDIAELVCWLELNELNGLKRLRRIVDNKALTTYHPVALSHAGGTVTIDGLGQSAILYALPGLDFAKALIRQHSGSDGQSLRVDVINVADAMFFIAAAASQEIDLPLLMTGDDNGQKFSASINLDRVKIAVHNGTESPSNNANRLQVTFAEYSEAPDKAIVDEGHNFSGQRTRADALANGISVDPALWQSLVKESKRILVPSSEHSRLFGTGGGDANE